jgi:hypothetical protein
LTGRTARSPVGPRPHPKSNGEPGDERDLECSGCPRRDLNADRQGAQRGESETRCEPPRRFPIPPARRRLRHPLDITSGELAFPAPILRFGGTVVVDVVQGDRSGGPVVSEIVLRSALLGRKLDSRQAGAARWIEE